MAKLFLLSITRLSKFETFRKIVVEELASLEKDTQILAAMEKEALVCTASCVPAQKGASSQVTGGFFGVFLGFLECAAAQTEYVLQPAKGKVHLCQLSCMLTSPLIVIEGSGGTLADRWERILNLVWHLHLVNTTALGVH